ncbi:E3 ubiquitin-protein ligase TRIM39-like isoform X2 [Lepisosteus oculatus]|uniref:E3 ubiquitin-protein ligase TRIM39-like isoform X2 n=1 Tax=Lepisosteus oculatus TaxID=7918 RepID=UPI00371225AB
MGERGSFLSSAVLFGMASPSSVLSEEQFQCSICLDTFTSPVSTPCGHNYCLACIGGYWDSSDLCQCPLCKKTFYRRPDLSVNRSLAEITEQFKRTRVSSDEGLCAKPGEVSCDSCTGRKLKAVKSCLVCLASYCETHIQPHYQGAAFRRHRLIEPVMSLEDRLCEKHERLLELFCRTDQTCVCVLCTETDHRTHSTVPLEQECGVKKTQLRKTEAEVQQMIQERLKKVEEIKQAVELSKSSAEREIVDSVQVFTSLRNSIERSQAELIELIEEKQRAAERRAEGIIKELEQEITELKRRNTELEQLSHTEDHIHFLQSFSSLCSPPHPKDWSDITVHPDLCLGALSKAVCQLEDRLIEEMEKVPGVTDVTLDPNTAHPKLILSEDGKQVRHGDTRQDLPDNPERFDRCVNVLGKDGITSGRHYWEVEVGEKTDWTLGVARESINRKGKITLSPRYGYWTVWLRNGNEIEACAGPPVLLPLGQKPQKVGVYVDYERGQVSFYNVDNRSHIYTFTASFTEKLFPFFGPGLHQGGTNSAPLIICPVSHTG